MAAWSPGCGWKISAWSQPSRLGDSIVIGAKKVYLNSEEITEPYIAAESAHSGSWMVPEGNLFVLGDNRMQSSDSHS